MTTNIKNSAVMTKKPLQLPSSRYSSNDFDNSIEDKESEQQDEKDSQEDKLNGFEDEIFDLLPNILKNACDVFDQDHERDIFFTGSLGVLSACLPNVYGIYDHRKVYPNLYFLVGGRASIGKGVMAYAQKMARPIHKKLNQREAILFIPTNSGSSEIIRCLKQNKQEGILFTTEADTINYVMKQDWGNMSWLLRQAFQHEDASMRRKGEYVELDAPKLSSVFSGTFDQIRTLLPEIENGLFSRFCFYVIAGIKPKFKNVFAEKKISYDTHFDKIGKELLEIYDKLASTFDEIEFQLTEKQEVKFLKKFEKWFSKSNSLYGDKIDASIFRLGLSTYRICMILSILRFTEENEDLEAITKIICKDIDFDNAFKITDTLKEHLHHIFLKLDASGSDKKGNSSKRKLYSLLPSNEPFSKKKAVEIGKGIGISERSVGRYLGDEKLYDNSTTNADLKYGHYYKK